VRLYVGALPSYRRLAAATEDIIGISVTPRTLNRWVERFGADAKTPLEMSNEFQPTSWGGILGVDGTWLTIRGQPWVLLVAVDQSTRDIVHVLLRRSENAAGFTQLLTDIVTETSYPLKALVTDASGGFLSGWATHFGGLPLQLCRVHFLRRLDEYLPTRPYGTHRPDPSLTLEYKNRVRSILLAATHHQATTEWDQLVADTDHYRGLAKHDPIRVLTRHINQYLTHHTITGLPADNNITEGVNSQLAIKLDLTRGFATETTTEHFTRLLIAWYRHKTFTDTTNGTNGQSPLTLAGANLATTDWLTNTQPN
jgi:transposase-like protein